MSGENTPQGTPTPEAAAAAVAASMQQPPAPPAPAPAPAASPPAAPQAAPVAAPVAAPQAPAAQPPTQPAPAPQAAPQAPPAAPPAAAPQQPPPQVPLRVDGTGENDPAFLKTRLERAKTSAVNGLLGQLGVGSVEEARAAIAAKQAAEDAGKTAEQRLAEAQATLAAQQAIIDSHAQRAIAPLNENERADLDTFVGNMRAMGVKGSDSQLQLAALTQLQPIWARAAAAAPPVAPAQPAAQPPAQQPAPISTSPAPGAPAESQPGSPPDAKALYNNARTINPFAAAEYGLANPQVYQKT